jgi:small subunit ribosomal protein S7
MRRRRPQKREILPDPKFGSVLATKFMNSMMYSGKKSVAERQFYKAIDIAKDRTGEDGIEVFTAAIRNVEPVLEVKSRRVGGSTYQVPVEIRPSRKTALAIRWVISYARSRNDKNFSMRLANELIAAFKKEGGAFRKREDVHRMAEANKAFAHFRW